MHLKLYKKDAYTLAYTIELNVYALVYNDLKK